VVKILLIGMGGFIGAILRYFVSGVVQGLSKSALFPIGTLGVNVIGCLLIGLLSYLVEYRAMLSVEVRVFLMIGLLGAFTTYSTFGNETFELMRESSYLPAMINIGAHLLLGLMAVWLGRIIGFTIWR